MTQPTPDRTERLLAIEDSLTHTTWKALGVKVTWPSSTCAAVTFPFPVEGEDLRSTIQGALGDTSVDIQIDFACPRAKIKEGVKAHPRIKNIILVGSGKGGVGKSTVAVNLALGLKRSGARVGLLDADIYGPSFPTMLDVREKATTQDKQFLPIERLDMPTLSIGYLVDAQTAMVWRGPMMSSALQQLLEQTLWPDLDYLIVDLPPGTGDVPLTLSQKFPIAGAVLVSTPQRVAVTDAEKAYGMFEKLDIPILGWVENMTRYVCAHCSQDGPLFVRGPTSDILQPQDKLGALPFYAMEAAEGAFDPSVADTLDHPAVSQYNELAKHLSRRLALRPRDYSINFSKVTLQTGQKKA